MADHFFPTEMPNFVPETSLAPHETTAKDSFIKLLPLPYATLADTLKKSAFALKQKALLHNWLVNNTLILTKVVNETWGLSGKRVQDYTLYTGALGTACLLFKAYQVTKNDRDLKLCSDIVKACDFASRDSGLWKCSSWVEVCPISSKSQVGLAGIMHVLMDMELKPDEVEDVKDTLHYMIKNRFPSGNYHLSEGSESDSPVHWCHGAPGVTLTLVKAAQVFGDKEFLHAAVDAGEVVWKRGLLKRVGICHGISGNTYVFLSFYQLTGNVEYLCRAKAFACFLHERSQKLIAEGFTL